MNQPLEVLKKTKSTLQFLYQQRISGLSPPDGIHFDEETRACFEALLAGSKFYLEFGGGGSTIAAHERAVPTICVESDRYYADVLRMTVGPSSAVTILYADIGVTGAWGRPLIKSRTRSRLKRWKSYVESPFKILKERFEVPDLVLVDGRFRRACALMTGQFCTLSSASTTLLFDDYYNDGREHYRAIEAYLGRPRRVGRAAIFHVTPESIRVAPSGADIDAAIQDYR